MTQLKIPFYGWNERNIGVVEIHSRQLFTHLKRKGVTLVPKYWEGDPSYDVFHKLGPPGLVSISRHHWMKKHCEVLFRELLGSEYAWRAAGMPGRECEPHPDPLRIYNLVAAADGTNHLLFSRDQALGQVDGRGYLATWTNLQRDVDEFIERYAR